VKHKLCILIIIFGLISLSYGGTTGKVSGKIINEKGEPLLGVNVLIENTYLGSSTDENGYYVILNVSPGYYNLKTTYIGYGSVKVTDIKISIDLSTTIDVKMEPEVLAAGEEVVVIAEKPLLNQDEFASKHIVSSEEMDVQPIEDVLSIAKKQAGAVGNNFRGGRSGEVLVVIDGFPVKDPAAGYTGDFGGFSLDIPKDAVQEMEVSLGGFSAEYGNVQSGVLNLALKGGSRKFGGSVYSTTTNFGGLNDDLMPKDDWWLDAKYQHKLEDNFRFSFHGPILHDLTFSISGEIFNRQQGYFLNQKRNNQNYQGKIVYNLSKNANLSIGYISAKQEWDSFYFSAAKYGAGDDYQSNLYEFIQYLDSENDTLIRYHYVNNPFDTTRYQSELVDSLVNSYFITLNDSDSVAVNYHKDFYLDSPLNHLTSRNKESRTLYGILSYVFSSKTFMELRVQVLNSSYINGMRDYSDKDGDGDTNEFLDWDNKVIENVPRPEKLEREYEFWWLRGDDSQYRSQKVRSSLVKLDLTSQINQNHMLKTGVQLNHNNTDVTDITWSSVSNDANFALNTLRKDIWENDDYDFGAYVQDKMEFEDALVAMIGLRFDYFNPNGSGDPILFPGGMLNPIVGNDSLGHAIFNDPVEAEASYQISPRIGISHPISHRDILFFTYGHYFQRPDGRYLYRNHQYQSLTKVGNWVGNPALKPERTVAYDISYEHLFSRNLKISFTGYFKDVSDLVNHEKFVFPDGTEVNQYVNGDYANIKGVEIAIKRQKVRFWSLWGNITYSIAKGRNSSSGGVKLYPFDKKMYFLDFDRRLSANVNLTLFSNNGLPGFRLFTHNWMANFQYEFGTGKPFTTYGELGATNDQRLPSFDNLDLRISRRFQISNVSLTLNIDVFNVLQNEVHHSIYTKYYNVEEKLSDENLPDVAYKEALTDLTIRTPSVYPSQRQFKLGISLKF